MPELTGPWIGTLTYGDNYKTLAGNTMDFKIDINASENGIFTGECQDLDDIGKYTGISVVNGEMKENNIRFTKQYTSRWSLTESGMAVIKPNEPGQKVIYTGRWNREWSHFEGEWYIEGSNGSGSWEMAMGDIKQTIEEDDIIIKTHFDKIDIKEVLFTQWEKTASKGTRMSVIIMSGILVLAVVSYKLMMEYQSIGWTIALLFSGIAFIWSIDMLMKNARLYNRWKKATDHYINMLGEDQSHTLIINEKVLMIQTPHELSVIRWKEMKEVNIYDDYILLMGAYAVIAASMTDDEYQLIKKYASGLYNSK